MPVTRGGAQSSGLSKKETDRELEYYCTLTLNGISTSSVIRAAQVMQDEHEHKHDPPKVPAPPTVTSKHRTFDITPLSELAKFRPKVLEPVNPPSTQSSDRHQESPYNTRRERRNAQKRVKERNTRKDERETVQLELGTSVKGFQRAHVAETQRSSLTIDVEVPNVASDTRPWTGPKDDDVGEEFTLEDVLAAGLQLIEYDGSDNLLIKDSDNRTLILMAKGLSRLEQRQLQQLFEQAFKDLDMVGTDIWHRRGRYYTRIFGLSFGGGQVKPGNLVHSDNDEDVWDRFSNSDQIKAIARRMDYLLECYFPRIHSLYTNTLEDLCNADPTLKRSWNDCCFAASSLNFEHAVTVKHRDSRNFLFRMCVVVNCGPFNYKKGGHLIIWDLGIVIEFPPGCYAFLPSAMLAHSNTSIATTEKRWALTFFTAAGLLRSRHNGYMSDHDFLAYAPKQKREQWQLHRDELWRTGLEILSHTL